MRVARSPTVWVPNLSTRHTVIGDRRWLVRRCYLNPEGFKVDAGLDEGHSGTFESFRSVFVNAGFEIIDCPTLTTTPGDAGSRSKNAADIRLAVDVMDALHDPVHIEEFVIVSGDSDFTPLLHRLRAADRRTTVLSPRSVAAGFRAAADRLLGLWDIVSLLDKQTAPGAPRPAEAAPLGWDDVREVILAELRGSQGEVLLPSLGKKLRSELGRDAINALFEKRKLGDVIRSLDLPGTELTADRLRQTEGQSGHRPAGE